jgi:hypothetical protein
MTERNAESKNVTINSLDDYNRFLSDGYEVKRTRFHGHPEHMYCTIVLSNGKEEIVANSNSIDEYVLHLRELYDFDKQKPCFLYVSDTELYHNFDEELFAILPNTPIRPIQVKTINYSPNQIYNELQNWIIREE